MTYLTIPVLYHSPKWSCLTLQGWVTGWVDRDGVAVMFPPEGR